MPVHVCSFASVRRELPKVSREFWARWHKQQSLCRISYTKNGELSHSKIRYAKISRSISYSVKIKMLCRVNSDPSMASFCIILVDREIKK